MSSEAEAVAEVGEKVPEKLSYDQKGKAKVEEEAPKKQTEKKNDEIQEEDPKKQTEKKNDEIQEEDGLKKVILKSCDGEEFELDVEAVKPSLMIRNMIIDGCCDGIVLVHNVMSAELAKLVEFLNHHVGASEEEMSELMGWNAEFVEVERDDLIDLMMAANYLEVRPLFELTTLKIANTITDMTVEEVRDYFDIENDYPAEEEAKYREEHKWAFELPPYLQ